MRKTLLLIALALALLGGTTLAQDLPPTFCGDLSQADCTILMDSAQTMRELNSAAFQFQLDFAMDHIPQGTPDSINFRITGNGAYAIEPGALSALMISPSEMMRQMDQLPQILEDAVKAISADATLLLYLPQNLPNSNGRPLPSRVGLSLRLVDGKGYINLDKMAELDTSGKMPHGWVGVDLAAYIRQAMKGQTLSLGTLSNMNAEAMSWFTDPEHMSRYMSVTRGDDTTVDGQNAATFDLSVDLGALFSDPDYQAFLRQQMQSTAGTTGLSQKQLDSIMTMYSKLFDGFVVHVTQAIGLDDQYLHNVGLTLDWALDFSGMSSAFGTQSSSSVSTPPINLHVNFQAGLSQFNSAPEITAPEGARLVPLNQLFGDFGQSFKTSSGK